MSDRSNKPASRRLDDLDIKDRQKAIALLDSIKASVADRSDEVKEIINEYAALGCSLYATKRWSGLPYFLNDVKLTVLQAVVAHQKHVIANVLLASGADPNFITSPGSGRRNCGPSTTTALDIACYNSDVPMVELLLSHGANASISNCLACAIPFSRPMSQELFNTLGAPDYASMSKRIVKRLLDAGANHAFVAWGTSVPLHFCTHDSMAPIAQLLLAAGADPNAATTTGWTLLHFIQTRQASLVHWYSHPAIKVYQVLLNAGADLSLRNSTGRTPADTRCDHPTEVVSMAMLLQAGSHAPKALISYLSQAVYWYHQKSQGFCSTSQSGQGSAGYQEKALRSFRTYLPEADAYEALRELTTDAKAWEEASKPKEGEDFRFGEISGSRVPPSLMRDLDGVTSGPQAAAIVHGMLQRYYPGTRLASDWRRGMALATSPRHRAVVRWRHAGRALQDRGLAWAAASEGRPMELARRLRLGKLAGALVARGMVGGAGGDVTALEAARLGGHEECVKLLEEAMG